MKLELSTSLESNGATAMETQGKPEEGQMTDAVATLEIGSLLTLNTPAPYWMLWRMKWLTHSSQQQERKSLRRLATLLMKSMITFPASSLPDMGDWDEDDEDEIYE